MNRFYTITLISAVCGLSLACSKKEEPKTETAPVSQPAEVPAPAPEIELPDMSPDEPQTTASEIPVAEDYEEEAERTVHADNLEAELDRLEAEIMGD